jgi:hypothetical protein
VSRAAPRERPQNKSISLHTARRRRTRAPDCRFNWKQLIQRFPTLEGDVCPGCRPPKLAQAHDAGKTYPRPTSISSLSSASQSPNGLGPCGLMRTSCLPSTKRYAWNDAKNPEHRPDLRTEVDEVACESRNRFGHQHGVSYRLEREVPPFNRPKVWRNYGHQPHSLLRADQKT